MTAFRRALLLFPALSIAVLSAQPATVASGRITGNDLGDVQSWLGIPYAAPPVGPLRWKAPQAPPSWEGVRAMDHYGAVCMQVGAGDSMSEDCLTLNVWAPKGATSAAVMVWFHGGAFIQGSGAQPIYAGAELARQGVVVVTLNYRLGDFGFFAHPELTKESGADPAANFGFQDQVAALRWVRQNIAAFGGDPRNVTVFGESAGGVSVNFLMISPPARGLFQKAIAESGGGEARTRTLSDAEQEGTQRAQQWGAANLAAMRALPAKSIQSAPRRLVLGGIGPIVDGKFVLQDPAHAFSAGKQAPVPFLLGANSYEASLMPLFGITPEIILAGVVGNGDKVRQFYGSEPQKQAQGIFTDAIFLAPARYLAAQMEKVKQPAYLYFFSYVAERRRAQVPGAQHGGEIPFVFNQFPLLVGAVTAEDRKMGAGVSAAWVRFAKTGDPNLPALPAGIPVWPAYTSATDRLLEWGSTIEVREHFRAGQLDLMTAVALARAK